MTKKETEVKKELARMYYMQGETQKAIAQKTDVSETTISKWVAAGGWEAKRAANNITRPELVMKNLLAINEMLNAYNNSDDPEKKLDADKMCKLANVIEKLDKNTTVVDVIEVFIAFNKWLQFRMSFDPELTPELIKAINKYQDLYITEFISK
ncbi:hypothetical protein AGMMS4956_14200 [Bacteroidia bacterium]|nr:hypothetical protein AGMMS4956_14200 [Bacteroidia bacterium]